MSDAWTLARDLTATVRSWVDTANSKSLSCVCTSPLSGCRCGRPASGGGLCTYCRTNCQHDEIDESSRQVDK